MVTIYIFYGSCTWKRSIAPPTKLQQRSSAQQVSHFYQRGMSGMLCAIHSCCTLQRWDSPDTPRYNISTKLHSQYNINAILTFCDMLSIAKANPYMFLSNKVISLQFFSLQNDTNVSSIPILSLKPASGQSVCTSPRVFSNPRTLTSSRFNQINI